MGSESNIRNTTATHSTCPWCAEPINDNTASVSISSPGREPPSYNWDLHTDCAAEWREFVTHLRTLAGRGAFETLVKDPLRGDVNEMVDWLGSEAD